MGEYKKIFDFERKPDFQRLVKTLFGKKADAVPLIELGIDPSIKEKISGHPLQTVADDIQFMRSMGYDFIKIQPAIQFQTNRQLMPKSIGATSNQPAPDRAWAAEHEGIISNWEDFEKYPWPRTEDIDYSRFEQARGILPDNMGIIGQYGDIYTTVWEMMGFENFAMAIYEQPDLVEALFHRVSELILSMFRTMTDMDWVGVIWYSDDIAYSSGLMVAPEFLRSHFFPLLHKIGERCASRKIPFIYHTDGVLWDVFDDIIKSGVTAIHPIEPKSMNIREVKQKFGNQLCLCGGIEVDVLARGSVEEVRNLVQKYITEIAPGGGYCLGSSNSIPEYVKAENYLAMVETGLRIGKYKD